MNFSSQKRYKFPFLLTLFLLPICFILVGCNSNSKNKKYLQLSLLPITNLYNLLSDYHDISYDYLSVADNIDINHYSPIEFTICNETILTEENITSVELLNSTIKLIFDNSGSKALALATGQNVGGIMAIVRKTENYTTTFFSGTISEPISGFILLLTFPSEVPQELFYQLNFHNIKSSLDTAAQNYNNERSKYNLIVPSLPASLPMYPQIMDVSSYI